MSLAVAAAITLGFLFLFFLAVFFALLYLGGILDIYLLLGITVAANGWFWLYGPRISDWVYDTFYDLAWISPDELEERNPDAAAVVERVERTHGVTTPKLGIIDDENPNAFTYGSGRWNSRIVVTEGLFTYLDEDEQAAVYAHELGHIVHRDFVVMTIATTLLQLLFQIYIITARPLMQSGPTSRQDQLRGLLAFVGIAAYLFYWAGQFMVLYLSRIREYYADEFVADVADPDALSTALVKVAYGILANPTDPELVEANRYRAIQSVAVADDVGLLYHNCRRLGDFQPLRSAFVYDLLNPWARLLEFGSTHPLTGKRIRRLARFTPTPSFDIDAIEAEAEAVNRTRLYRRFTTDVMVLLGTLGLMIGFPVVFAGAVLFEYVAFSWPLFVGGWVTAFGLASIVSPLYAYPSGSPKETRIVDLMADVYASPIRGKHVRLSGELVGRGVPGLVFSEDMLVEDESGLIYLDYESWLPIVGDHLFGLDTVPNFLDKEATFTGWYVRGTRPIVYLDRLTVDRARLRGWAKPGNLGGGIVVLAAGLAIPFGYSVLERTYLWLQALLVPWCHEGVELLVVGFEAVLAPVEEILPEDTLLMYVVIFLIIFGAPVAYEQLARSLSQGLPETRAVMWARESGQRCVGWLSLVVVGILTVGAVLLTMCMILDPAP